MTIRNRSPKRRNELNRLAWLGIFESFTLVVLVLVAVPLKYGFDQVWMVRGLGPIHGLAFLMYIWTIFQYSVSGLLSKRAALILAAIAFVPFGFLFARQLISQAPERELNQ